MLEPFWESRKPLERRRPLEYWAKPLTWSVRLAPMRAYSDREVRGRLADCYLDLDIRGVSMLDFDDPAGIANLGYEAVMPVLETWLESSIASR